mmetsp:Transcript_18281/g.35921  ORF Transcript_18281/g.35921 Transcript_18281/m.35921 type:complete len:269 (-) Transcript_18281:752-1558(-)
MLPKPTKNERLVLLEELRRNQRQLPRSRRVRNRSVPMSLPLWTSSLPAWTLLHSLASRRNNQCSCKTARSAAFLLALSQMRFVDLKPNVSLFGTVFSKWRIITQSRNQNEQVQGKTLACEQAMKLSKSRAHSIGTRLAHSSWLFTIFESNTNTIIILGSSCTHTILCLFTLSALAYFIAFGPFATFRLGIRFASLLGLLVRLNAIIFILVLVLVLIFVLTFVLFLVFTFLGIIILIFINLTALAIDFLFCIFHCLIVGSILCIMLRSR